MTIHKKTQGKRRKGKRRVMPETRTHKKLRTSRERRKLEIQ